MCHATDGSLARQHVRDTYFGQSWDAFNAAVEDLRPKSADDIAKGAAFWWLLPDIVVSDRLLVGKDLVQPS